MENKKYVIETTYKNYRFRSRLEARWAYFFDKIGVQYRYEPEGYEFFGMRYLPDFLISIPRYNMCDRVFVEIKPEIPSGEERYKAKWLAEYTRIPVYIFFGDIWLPEQGGARAQLFMPTEFVLTAPYQTPDTKQIEAFPFFISQDIRIVLLQLQKIGCLLTFQTDLKQKFEVRCSWQKQVQQYKTSSLFWDDPSPNEVSEALQRYRDIEEEFKETVNNHIGRSLSRTKGASYHDIPFIFTIQTEKPTQEDGQFRWVSCLSCKNVGIYPHHFGHYMDCGLYYDKQGWELDLNKEKIDKRSDFLNKESQKIKEAYVGARAVRFEYGESPDR